MHAERSINLSPRYVTQNVVPAAHVGEANLWELYEHRNYYVTHVVT